LFLLAADISAHPERYGVATMARKAKATATRKSRKTPPTAKRRLNKKRLAKNRLAKKRLTKKRPAKKRPVKKRAPKTATPPVETLNVPVAPARRAGLRRRARAELAPPPVAAAAIGIIDQITALAARSRIAKYGWKDDGGKAPLAYIKGMALVYARVYCKLKAGDPAATEMAKAKTADANRDVLAFYDEIFAAAGMRNDTSGADTLRHLFVLLTGLGIRESSGRHCVGRYMNQDFHSADDAEAGLFQASYNVTRSCKPILPNLFAQYTANPAGFLEVFSVGITCKPADWKNWGDPGEPGFKWQQLTKTCPAFAAEFAAVGLRNNRLTWGPIRAKKVEVVPDCDTMFKDVETLMDSAPGLCAQVL
jgi:hypothetical protein